MLIAGKLLPGGAGLAPALRRRAATVALDWETRQKSRFDFVDSNGRTIGVFLPRGGVVRGGDVLVVEDGSLVAVEARAQAVLVVTASRHGSPHDLLRAAYHLGNRHVPLQVAPSFLQLEPDHVLADLLRGMGLDVVPAEAAFEPEAGAYGAGRHAHPQPPAHGHAHAQPHAHAPETAHDHAHEHSHDQTPAPTEERPPDCHTHHGHGDHSH